MNGCTSEYSSVSCQGAGFYLPPAGRWTGELLPLDESIMVASIEYIERVIATFTAAAEANLHAPGRQGNTIVLDGAAADEIMVTGDLHGHRRNFNLIRRIAALETLPRRHVVVQEVCHGGPTYPQNGGCMSHAVVEDIARLKVQYPDRVHFLPGESRVGRA